MGVQQGSKYKHTKDFSLHHYHVSLAFDKNICMNHWYNFTKVISVSNDLCDNNKIRLVI